VNGGIRGGRAPCTGIPLTRRKMLECSKCSTDLVVLIFLWYAAPSLVQTPSRPSDSNKGNSSSEKHLVAGMDVVGLPVCTYLPTPPITKEAKAAKFHGVVLLLGVIELDGRIAKIRVIKGAGLGLDESAINTIKNGNANRHSKMANPSWRTLHSCLGLARTDRTSLKTR
jgi:hypothetical protein